MPIGFATRIAAYFGGLFILAMGTLFAFWYYGLPQLGLSGASQQKLSEAMHVLEVTADHRIASISQILRESRGDMLVVSENKAVSQHLSTREKDFRTKLQADLERIFVRLQRAYPDRYERLLLLDPAGEILASTRPAEVGRAFPNGALVQRLARPGVTEVIDQAGDQLATLVIARQIRALDEEGHATGEVLGIAVVFLDPRYLLSGITGDGERGLGHTGSVVLFDHHGQLLAQYPGVRPDAIAFRLAKAVPQGFEGSTTEEESAGRSNLVVYRHLRYGAFQGWTLVHYRPVEDVLAGLHEETRRLAWTGLAFTFAALTLIIFGARRATRRLRILAAATARLGSGDLSVRLPSPLSGPEDEISGLSQAFNAMAEHLQNTYQHLEAEVQARTLELQQERDRAQRYLDIAGVMLMAVDAEGRISMINKMGARLLGQPAERLVGMDWFQNFLLPEERPAVIEGFRLLLAGKTRGMEYFENHIVDGAGITRLMAWHNSLLQDRAGKVVGVLSSGEDITERRAAEAEIQNLAFYDPLTKLPNRRLLLDRLQLNMEASTRDQHYRALLFLDLDNFKTLNDSLGHDVGDRLLIEVARRLQACVRKSDTVSRLGGDEFVVLLDSLGLDLGEAAARADAVGEHIISAISESYDLGQQTYRGTTSIGITLVRGRDIPVEELFKRADLAMYQAKAAGRNALRFFDPVMQASMAARLALENELRRAIADREFSLYYQPQVDATGRCFGVEALIRWLHPARGLVSPADFIPLAEERGLIEPIGQWVLQEACSQLVAWRENAATAGLSIAVNVSPRQFRHPAFVDEVKALLENSGADPERLKIEITESLFLDDIDETISKMAALRVLGVGFSLDDFGTGYSSLAYLKRLPINQVKIDRSFVRDILVDPNDAIICRAIIALGKSLGLDIIAEGVETSGQWQALAAEGCKAAQGYLYGKPMARPDLLAWLAERQPAKAL